MKSNQHIGSTFDSWLIEEGFIDKEINFPSRRLWAMWVVANNWRIRNRLPRLTRAAEKLGFI